MNRKIDLYLYSRTRGFWRYECSTNMSKTCKEAKRDFCAKHGLDAGQVIARFAERVK